MQLLLDVDAAVKLAHWRLLIELPVLLGCQWQDIATISSLRYRALRAQDAPDGRLFHTCEAASLVLAALEHMQPLPAPDPDRLAAFQDVPGIDPGEALLFSLAADQGDAVVLTGDKRALGALATLAPEMGELLRGRVLTVESIVELALRHFGIDWLRERVCPSKDIDKAIAAVMGSRCDAPEDSVREGLQSYLRDVRRRTGPFLREA